jgi:hypothetical protein
LTAAVALVAVPIHAQTLALTTSTAGATAANNNQTVGWRFDVSGAGLTVNGLGWYDQGNDGLSRSYQVGIWNAGGTLLGSATVPGGTAATLNNGFRVVSITSFFLPAANGYIVGGLNSTESTDQLLFNSTIATIAGVTFRNATFSDFGLGFVPPTQNSVANTGFFGPNFTVGPTVVIPEPSTVLLLGAGLVLVAATARRRALG